MKAFINALDRRHLLLMISLLCFFNGLALMAYGVAFFDGDSGRIVPLAFAFTAFYCAVGFFKYRNDTVELRYKGIP